MHDPPGTCTATISIELGTPVYVGDANCDSGVDIADAISILTFLFGSPGVPGKTPCCLANADANGDAGVDIADAIAVLGFLFSSTPMTAPDSTPIPPLEDGCIFYQGVTLGCDEPCAK